MLTRKEAQDTNKKSGFDYPVERPGLFAWLALKSIRFYKLFLSPLLPSACRFTPTCSAYMYEAIAVHGLLRGVRLGMWRIWRCQPMYPGGSDPVPPRESRV